MLRIKQIFLSIVTLGAVHATEPKRSAEHEIQAATPPAGTRKLVILFVEPKQQPRPFRAFTKKLRLGAPGHELPERSFREYVAAIRLVDHDQPAVR